MFTSINWKAHWKYLGICQEHMVTAFGLTSAPRQFTMVLRPIITGSGYKVFRSTPTWTT